MTPITFKRARYTKLKNGKLIDGHGKESYNTYDNVYDINDSFYARFKEIKG